MEYFQSTSFLAIHLTFTPPILYIDIKYSCLYIHIGEIASFVDILLATELYAKHIIPIKSTLFFFSTVQSYIPFFPHFVIQS